MAFTLYNAHRRISVIGQSNTNTMVAYLFKNFENKTKHKLLYTYCSRPSFNRAVGSVYNSMKSICVNWRKARDQEGMGGTPQRHEKI